MLKIALLLITILVSTARAEGLYREAIEGLTYRHVGKIVCYNTKVMSDEQAVDVRIYGKLEAVRGQEAQVLVMNISAETENPPTVIVVEGVSLSRGELVWSNKGGWFEC